MKTIQLTQGQIALVDDEDFERLNAKKWCARKKVLKGGREVFYATRGTTPEERARGMSTTVDMHREVMGFPKGLTVDHRDRVKTLDNRKRNLRTADYGQQSRNRSGWSKLGLPKGVQLERGGRYRVRIMRDGVSYYVGAFDTIPEATLAYNHASAQYHQEFSAPNVTPTGL